MGKNSKALTAGIGLRIAERRKELGFTQQRAAELSGLSHQFFSSVEIESKNLRAESIIKVSRALKVSSDFILFGESNQHDRGYLLELLEPLNEVQLKCMENIMKSYLAAFGYQLPPHES